MLACAYTEGLRGAVLLFPTAPIRHQRVAMVSQVHTAHTHIADPVHAPTRHLDGAMAVDAQAWHADSTVEI